MIGRRLVEALDRGDISRLPFAWRFLGERTGGSGKWPVTATTNWTVVWQSNTGVSGVDALTATTADQWDVGEYRTVLVQGSGG